LRSEHTLSLREQLLLVGVAAPLAVFILVLAPYYFAHYYVYKDAYLLAPPPPIGGARALEGHWTDVDSAPVKPFKFGAPTASFGWLGVSADLTTPVLPTAFGAIREVHVKIGDAVAKDAPLFSVEPMRRAPDAASDQHAKTDMATISAPAEGVITKLDVDVGSVIENTKAGRTAPLASISDLSALSLTAAVDEDEARIFKPGDSIDVRPAAAEKTFKGRIVAVIPSSDPGLAEVRAIVDNPDGVLRPNMLVRFTRTGDEPPEALAVPVSAVLFENGSARVWVVGADKSRALTPRTIRTGRIADGMVEVVDGLTRDDQVATSDVVFIDRAAKGY
jgi:multidrug efflux pump subunit AcrA (membrane-fusion protein)